MMRDGTVYRQLVHGQLAYCQSTAHAYHDAEMELRCARALIAFDAPLDMDIFTDELIQHELSLPSNSTLDK